jgi:uncharacterized integral membrane protein
MNMVPLILVVMVIITVALFSVQNAMPVAILFLVWHFNASLAVIVLLFFLAGMIAGMGFLSWTRMRRAARKRSDARQKQPDSERHSELPG